MTFALLEYGLRIEFLCIAKSTQHPLCLIVRRPIAAI